MSHQSVDEIIQVPKAQTEPISPSAAMVKHMNEYLDASEQFVHDLIATGQDQIEIGDDMDRIIIGVTELASDGETPPPMESAVTQSIDTDMNKVDQQIQDEIYESPYLGIPPYVRRRLREMRNEMRARKSRRPRLHRQAASIRHAEGSRDSKDVNKVQAERPHLEK